MIYNVYVFTYAIISIPGDTFGNFYFYRGFLFVKEMIWVKNSKANTMAKVGLLAAVAAVLMILEFPVPLVPTFIQLDFSEIPVLLGTFALGPMAGVAIELVKNLVHLPFTKTLGIGELANFIYGCAYVIPAGYIYYTKKNIFSALIGMAIGTMVMTITAALLNLYVFIPLYQTALHFPLDAIIGLGTKANPAVVDLKSLIILAITPFNLVKGTIVSVVTFFLYKKLSKLLHK